MTTVALQPKRSIYRSMKCMGIGYSNAPQVDDDCVTGEDEL